MYINIIIININGADLLNARSDKVIMRYPTINYIQIYIYLM